jgi:hypothetical protein
MTLSIQAILFLSGAIQGAILSISILLKSQLRKEAKKMLVAFVLILTFQILLKVISKDWIGNYFGIPGIIAYQFPFLFGPVAYLFVKFSISENGRFASRDLLHFVPFLIPTFFIFLIFSNGVEWVGYFLPNSWLRGFIYVVIQLGMIGYYSFLSLQLCRSYEMKSKVFFSNLEKIRVNWLKQFIIASLVTSSAVTITLFFMYNLYPRYQDIRYVLLLQGGLIYWISYTAMVRPVIFKLDTLDQSGNEDDGKPVVIENLKLSSFKKYAHNNLSEENAVEIKSKIVNKMERDQLYLNPDLSIDEFSKLVGESRP